MRFCDFFAGIGGFRLGLERAGHKGVWACEVDSFCRKIYAQHFEEPQGKDINDVKAEEIPGAEIWCGGFPCQDNSVAGQRRGFRGSRSSVFWPWLRLIRQVRPKWLLIENVPGLYSVGEGLDFGLILRRLGDVGYGLSWRSLDAQFFGLAQRRKRVFIVGCFGEPCPPEILFERESGKRNPRSSREAGSEIAANIEGCSNNYGGLKTPVTARPVAAHPSQNRSDYTKTTYVVAGFMAGQGAKARSIGYREEQSPTLKAAESGLNRAPCIVSADPIHEKRSGKQLDAEGEMVRAISGDVRATAPPDTNGMREATGLPGRMDTPDSPRYKALGNAVAVLVVEWIGRRLKAHE